MTSKWWWKKCTKMVACSPCRASFISNWLHIVPSALVRLSLCWCVCVAWRFCYLIGSQEYVINDNKLLVHYAFKKWLFHAITKSQKNTKRKFWSVYGHAQWLTSNISLLFLFIFQQTYEENTEGHQLRDFDMLMYRQILGTSNNWDEYRGFNKENYYFESDGTDCCVSK